MKRFRVIRLKFVLKLLPVLSVYHYGHRSIIEQLYLHICTKDSCLNFLTKIN